MGIIKSFEEFINEKRFVREKWEDTILLEKKVKCAELTEDDFVDLIQDSFDELKIIYTEYLTKVEQTNKELNRENTFNNYEENNRRKMKDAYDYAEKRYRTDRVKRRHIEDVLKTITSSDEYIKSYDEQEVKVTDFNQMTFNLELELKDFKNGIRFEPKMGETLLRKYYNLLKDNKYWLRSEGLRFIYLSRSCFGLLELILPEDVWKEYENEEKQKRW